MRKLLAPRREDFLRAAEIASGRLADGDGTLCRFLMLYGRIAALQDHHHRRRLKDEISACVKSTDALVLLIEKDLGGN